jgi:hypothetical protein
VNCSPSKLPTVLETPHLKYEISPSLKCLEELAFRITPVILATQEAEIRRIAVQSQP